MSNQRIGRAGTTLEEVPNSPKIEKSENGTRIIHSYNVNFADAEAALTAAGIDFGDAHAAPYETSKLREININKGGPKNSILQLIFYPDTWPSSSFVSLPPTGTITLSTDSNAIDVPIGQNTIISPALDYDPVKNIGIGDLAGVEGYLEPRPIFRRTEILDAFVFSEAEIIKNVATRYTDVQMATQGMTAATTDKWLKTKLALRTVGDKFEKTEEWQFSQIWSAKLYAAATGS